MFFVVCGNVVKTACVDTISTKRVCMLKMFSNFWFMLSCVNCSELKKWKHGAIYIYIYKLFRLIQMCRALLTKVIRFKCSSFFIDRP